MNEPRPPASAESLLETALRENSRYRDQVYFLTEMGGLLGELELGLLLVKILELTAEFVGADVGSIVLQDTQGELETAVDWGLPHEVVVGLLDRAGQGLLEEALEAGRPRWYAGSELGPIEGGAYSIESVLLLPLRTERRTLGSIVLVLSEVDAQDRDEKLEVLGPAVRLAAIAVENEQLVRAKLERERQEQQLRLGRQIQLGLLPAAAPEVPGLELDAVYIPATEIGGDYYDYLRTNDGRLFLVIADVAGKGVAAGLVMTAVRSMFRTACRSSPDPARLLQQVNEQLSREHLDGFFVTAVCARVDVETDTLTLAVAGHEPPLLVRGGRPELGAAQVRQPALGLLEAVEFHAETYEFREGDVLVLYTDGVTEAMNEFRNQFGMRRLQDVVERCAGKPASEVLPAITAAVADHTGRAERHDDVTLLVARRASA